MELMLLIWKQSYVSDTYGHSVWVCNKMRGSFFSIMWVRNFVRRNVPCRNMGPLLMGEETTISPICARTACVNAFIS